jgi:CheY-like chemotaxis protein
LTLEEHRKGPAAQPLVRAAIAACRSADDCAREGRRARLLHGRAFANVGRMAGGRLTIVYADDDDLVREVVAQGLTEEDIDVHACADGDEVMALCTQINPDTVLLDLNMPRLDGLKTARQLRDDPRFSGLRLVAITGRGTWDLRRKAADAGFDEFLTKPVPITTLVRALAPA